jgi:hypothetical protein
LIQKALGIEAGKDGYQGPWKWYPNPEQQSGSTGDDPLCDTELDPLCEKPLATGDSGRGPIKGDQPDAAEPLWSRSANFGISGPYTERNEHGQEMPF